MPNKDFSFADMAFELRLTKRRTDYIVDGTADFVDSLPPRVYKGLEDCLADWRVRAERIDAAAKLLLDLAPMEKHIRALRDQRNIKISSTVLCLVGLQPQHIRLDACVSAPIK